ncbi:MAG: hypothetical protein CALGDGBN_03048 [Pseudomonadales bacterium]|nr:hypothetical protein [Pseudomonadales bacterium]
MKTSSTLALLGAAALSLVSVTASAAPVLGAQLYYAGGTVTVTSLPVTSGYTSELGLYDSSFTRLGYIMNDEPAGVTVDITSLISGSGISAGDELIFGIRILGPGYEYFMGGAGRNPDQLMHATVDVTSTSPVYTAIVGFEDLYGGGDLDYDDNKFRFEGGIRSDVPVPGTLGLLGLGLAGLGLTRRRKES